jgi:hydrogenase nickel incorporation protein HypA/HybF
MDERELANHVLEIVDQAAYRHRAQRITAVHLAIGGRRNFDLKKLNDAFGAAIRGTVAEGADLRVDVLPVRHRCMNCGKNFEAGSRDLPCPDCNHPHTELIGGEEIRVLGVQMDNTAA